MGGIAQRPVRLDGKDYAAGEPVPEHLVDERLVMLGLVARTNDTADVFVELDKVKAELAELRSQVKGATARMATAAARVAEPPVEPAPPGAKPAAKSKAKDAGATRTSG